MRDVVRILYIFYFLLLWIHCSCTLGLVIVFTHTLYLFFSICGCMFLSPTSTCVVHFLSLYTCFLLIVCNLLILFHTKMP